MSLQRIITCRLTSTLVFASLAAAAQAADPVAGKTLYLTTNGSSSVSLSGSAPFPPLVALPRRGTSAPAAAAGSPRPTSVQGAAR
jgi:hypothetical protein